MVERASLKMTEEEVDSFLRSQRVGLVSGHQWDGRLTSRRALYRVEGSTLELDVQPATRCFDLESNSELCFMVDIYPSHETIKSVIVYGRGTWSRERTAGIRMEMHRVVSFDFSKQG